MALTQTRTRAASGVVMSPSDTCDQQNYLNGSPTTTRHFSYNQMLAQEQPATGFAPWGIGIGVLMLGSGGFGLYRWFRKRTLYQHSQQTGRPVAT